MSLAETVSPLGLLARRDVLPVSPPLAELFPYGGPVRGGVVAVEGSMAMVLALVAAASARGEWAAAIGVPSLGLAAAAEAGVDLDRFVLVPSPGPKWATVAAVLVDGVGLLVLHLPVGAKAAEARRIAARVREAQAVLLVTGAWPERVDLRVRLVGTDWAGIGQGDGRITGRRCTFAASGRGAAARERQVTAWLPPAR
jgi:hypothetical protein